jgi:MFS family permease
MKEGKAVEAPWISSPSPSLTQRLPRLINRAGRPLPVSELLWISLYWFASSFQWGALLAVVLPVEVLRFAPEAQKGSYLAVLFAAGAVIALVMSPLAGAWSDRCTLALGRRRPFIVLGTLINCGGLVGMHAASSFPWFLGAFLVVQLANNLAAGAFHGLLPDKVPPAQRGLASGLMGLLMMLGTIAAAVASGRLVGQGQTGSVYWLIAIVLLASMTLTLWKVREELLEVAPPWRLLAFVRSLWIDPRQYPDFAWMFATRGLVMLGYYTLLAFLQFFVKDTLHLAPSQAAQTTGFLSAVAVAAGTVVAVAAGWASDRVGRKVIVSIAGTFLAVTCFGLLVQPPLWVLVGVAVLFGIGSGAYTSVDWALAIDVLPSANSAAKDLGVWAVANTLPQVLAPLVAGPILDHYNRQASNFGYTVIFSSAIIYIALGSILVWKIKGAK